MRKTNKKSDFNPYHRYENAMRRISAKDTSQYSDIWENKLYDILKVREIFKSKYKDNYLRHFESKCPLYAGILTAVEDTRVGGDRDLLEAVLLCGADLHKVSEELGHPRFDSLFLGLYKKLCYDVTPVLCNPALIFQHVISPMVGADSDRLAVGHIWKILALAGGINLLKRKGLDKTPIKAEDIEHLLQLASFRHCSSLLQYTSSGSKFFENNPAAAMAITALADFDSVRSSGRRLDYIGELSTVAKNNFNNILNGEFKLLSAPDEVVAKMAEFDGMFRPDISDTLEYSKHITFIDNEDIEDND